MIFVIGINSDTTFLGGQAYDSSESGCNADKEGRTCETDCAARNDRDQEF